MSSANANDVSPLRLSETSCIDGRRPVVVAWGARALYIGPALRLTPHRNAVAVLAVGLDDSLYIARKPGVANSEFDVCRCVLIEPDQLQEIRTPAHQCAFLYVDALSTDLKAIRARCTRVGPGVSFGLEQESRLITVLRGMPPNASGWQSAAASIACLLGLTDISRDTRMAEVARTLRDDAAQAHPVAELALVTGLSVSRLQHRFRQVTGVSMRRYRLWSRMQIALRAATSGRTLTQAAMEAGFASSAHLSTAFREMFGMSASQLLASKPVFIDTTPPWPGIEVQGQRNAG